MLLNKMLSMQRISLRRTCLCPQANLSIKRHIIKPTFSSLLTRRTAATSSSPSPRQSEKKLLYPERLIVYHAGTGRTVFLGCLKVTTIFIFAFFAMVVAPTHLYADDQPIWIAPSVLLSGTIPMAFVAYITSPFATYIHLRLPRYARQSREMLFRYAKTLSKTAELDITTMNFVGRPRVTRLRVGDIHPVKRRFGVTNFARDTTQVNKQRKWWMGRAKGEFGIHSNTDSIMKGEVWREIERAIRASPRRK